MDLVTLIVVIVVVGLIMYLINNFIPLDPTIKQILNVVVIIFLVLWLLNVFVGPLTGIRIGR